MCINHLAMAIAHDQGTILLHSRLSYLSRPSPSPPQTLCILLPKQADSSTTSLPAMQTPLIRLGYTISAPSSHVLAWSPLFPHSSAPLEVLRVLATMMNAFTDPEYGVQESECHCIEIPT